MTALYKRTDGIVDFDPNVCIGCKACMQACPYDALYIDPNTNTAAKCNFCAHRVENGLQPACEIVCPTQAILSGDLDDATSMIAQLTTREPVRVRKAEKGTLPQLFYINADENSLTPLPPVSTRVWHVVASRQTADYRHLVAAAGAGSSVDLAGRHLFSTISCRSSPPCMT